MARREKLVAAECVANQTKQISGGCRMSSGHTRAARAKRNVAGSLSQTLGKALPIEGVRMPTFKEVRSKQLVIHTVTEKTRLPV